ncbi:MAG: hypothetical protein WC471_02735 [Candidatus Woesearchaeota archaeon]|jgi:hypothetical protein
MENKNELLSRLCKQYELRDETKKLFSDRLDLIYSMEITNPEHTREGLLALVEETAKRDYERRMDYNVSKRGLAAIDRDYGILAANFRSMGEGMQTLAEEYQNIAQLTGEAKSKLEKLELLIAQAEVEKAKSEGKVN